MLVHRPRNQGDRGCRLGRPLCLLSGVVALLVLGVSIAAAEIDHTQEIIREKVEQLRLFKSLKIGDASVASSIVLPDFYARREFKLAWVKHTAIQDLFRAIRESEADGLDPRDYHLATLESLRRGVEASPTPAMLADFDILLTDALIRLSYHLMFGKVDPERLDPSWNMSREINGVDPVVTIQLALDSESLYQAIDREKPKHAFYTELKAALATYRMIKAAGGWPRLPSGPSLTPGMYDERLPTLRRRLSLTGDLAPRAADHSQMFDGALVEAVKTFQRRHGLAADGALGRETLAALNVPVEERIQQLRVNLERGRWILHNLGSTFIVVNVAGYHSYYVKDGQRVWQGRAQVGRPLRQTPSFKAEMTYLVFNPTWTVPPTILAQDYLPSLKQDPGFVHRKGLKVIDRAGRAVEPWQIDWSRYSASYSPYLLRQDPGPRNALGRVKFIFPNDHAIFLHDTPNQKLFDRTTRAFSSGCIRVENALDLARLLLDDEAQWSRKSIDRVIGSGKTRTVSLHAPVPVLLLYWTAWVGPDGRVNFGHDLYDRDKLVQKGLAGDFRFRKRPVFEVPPPSAESIAMDGRDVDLSEPAAADGHRQSP
jgi:murein L,D-transpeptidase YcbB/YkuD